MWDIETLQHRSNVSLHMPFFVTVCVFVVLIVMFLIQVTQYADFYQAPVQYLCCNSYSLTCYKRPVWFSLSVCISSETFVLQYPLKSSYWTASCVYKTGCWLCRLCLLMCIVCKLALKFAYADYNSKKRSVLSKQYQMHKIQLKHFNRTGFFFLI
jgi:hypothetical protein